MIAGKTLLGRVIEQARRSIEGIPDVQLVVATDDDSVADHAGMHGCTAILTPTCISSGSSRALAAAQVAPVRPRYVVNLQGDAPFFHPCCVADIINALQTPSVECVTPVVQLDWDALDTLRYNKAAEPFSGTTCIVAEDGRAIWFSKAIIPTIRGEDLRRQREPLSPIYRHVGIYGYSFDALARFEAAPPSTYEELEGLEQLRLLSLGISVHTVTVPASPIAVGGIDTPHDAIVAEEMIARFGDPHG